MGLLFEEALEGDISCLFFINLFRSYGTISDYDFWFHFALCRPELKSLDPFLMLDEFSGTFIFPKIFNLYDFISIYLVLY